MTVVIQQYVNYSLTTISNEETFSSDSEAFASELLDYSSVWHTYMIYLTGSNPQQPNSVLPVAKGSIVTS